MPSSSAPSRKESEPERIASRRSTRSPPLSRLWRVPITGRPGADVGLVEEAALEPLARLVQPEVVPIRGAVGLLVHRHHVEAGLEQAAVGGGHRAVRGAVDEDGVDQPGAAELLQQGVEAGGEGGGVEAGAPGGRIEPLGVEGAALRVGDRAELEVDPAARAGLVLADLAQQLRADVAHPPDHELQLGAALEEPRVDVAHGPAARPPAPPPPRCCARWTPGRGRRC